MSKKLEPSKRTIFIGVLITALGIIFSTTLKESIGSIGVIFIAVGGLILLIEMSKKRKQSK